MAAENAEQQIILHTNEHPVKVILQKAKGGYSWEIHVSGSSTDQILAVLREANKKLKSEYREA